jgi:hypothetical protein
MKLRQNVLYFILALFLHLVLLYLFVLGLYFIYFLALFSVAFLLYKYYTFFSYKVFLPLLFFIIILVNLNIYDEYLFELYLYFDAVDKNLHIQREVMYGLTTLHLLFLTNLKKFDNFWVIIDKKLFRI